MKKSTILFCFLTLLLMFTLAPAAWADPAILLNGQKISFDVPPALDQGRVMVPFRATFEAMGATVNWDSSSQTVTALKDGTEIKLTVNGAAFKNGLYTPLDQPAEMVSNRVLVPLRFVSEALGYQVNWNSAAETVSITTANSAPAAAASTDDAAANQLINHFLAGYKLTPQGSPTRFFVQVPASWDISPGVYPEGLYWQVANVFAQDAGFDLTTLKGKTVEVWRSELKDQLPGDDPTNKTTYPANAVLLISDGQIAGGWLELNQTGIGPSLNQKTFKQITKLTFQDWFAQKNLLPTDGIEADLLNQNPLGVMQTYFDASTSGNKTLAYACLGPQALLDCLTANRPADSLYNPGFTANNSLLENITSASLVSWEFIDPKAPSKILKINLNQKISQKNLEVLAMLQLNWRDSSQNTTGGQTGRYIWLTNTDLGWKIQKIDTGTIPFGK